MRSLHETGVFQQAVNIHVHVVFGSFLPPGNAKGRRFHILGVTEVTTPPRFPVLDPRSARLVELQGTAQFFHGQRQDTVGAVVTTGFREHFCVGNEATRVLNTQLVAIPEPCCVQRGIRAVLLRIGRVSFSVLVTGSRAEPKRRASTSRCKASVSNIFPVMTLPPGSGIEGS